MENTVQVDPGLKQDPISIIKAMAEESDSSAMPQGDTGNSGHPGGSELSETNNATGILPEEIKKQLEAERKILSNVMSICLTSDGLVIRDEEKTETEDISSRLSGVYCEGVQYYDLQGVQYINNTGMAILIDLLKALLEMGVEVQFVNVHDSIKKKIKDMGLEKIINYGENAGS